MKTPNRIPLFPLDVVLFPTMPLPLHVFEPRYKVMIRRCIEEPVEFGIVLATKEAIASVGCTARIVRKVKDYSDGRMDILTEGVSVFRLAAILDEKEYHEGMVEYLVDEERPPDLQVERQLLESFESCHLLLFGTSSEEAASGNSEHIAYRMASRLPIDLLNRQKLLEMRSERARREYLERWIAEFQPKLAQRRQAQHRAGSNGHGAI
jgi:Lon protease-like protein